MKILSYLIYHAPNHDPFALLIPVAVRLHLITLQQFEVEKIRLIYSLIGLSASSRVES